MPDHRTKRQKLEAMANQTASPNEAEVAQRKLDALGPDTTPTGMGIRIEGSSFSDIFDRMDRIIFEMATRPNPYYRSPAQHIRVTTMPDGSTQIHIIAEE